MPRTKALSDGQVLQKALALMRTGGPEALTFASLAASTGLSPATLVQRFGSKAKLKQAALLAAWDALDEKTASLIVGAPTTPAGAISILAGLSGDYGDIDSYAEGLLMLREDFRDKALRSRGAEWNKALTAGLDACFADTPGAPEGVGQLMAAQWQGALLWWGFEPTERVDLYVTASLRRLVKAILDPRLG